MKRHRLLSVLGIMLFAAGSLAAQEKPGTILSLEFQRLKNGSVPQYETARKQKAAWHKQQNDPQPLLVWETLSGDNTGEYLVARAGLHWADMDKPAVSDEADLAEYQKTAGAYVESLTTRYYEFLPRISNTPSGDMSPAKFSEIRIFEVKYGKESEFRSAIDRIHEGAQKTKWQPNYEWYVLVNGGRSGTFVLSLPHNNWADFADKSDVKPFRDMLNEAFGQAEADSLVDRIDRSVEKETSEIIKFRGDLSYLPGK